MNIYCHSADVEGDKSFWYAEASFDDRHTLKDAGFRWNARAKHWFTERADVAARLREHVVSDQVELLDQLLEAEASVEKGPPVSITFDSENYRWVAAVEYEDREIVRDAGFRWDSFKRCWYSESAAVAKQLIEYCDESAKKEIGLAPERAAEKAAEAEQAAALRREAREQAKRAEKEAALAASRATDADIDVPVPEGLEYLPFQKAGIAYAMDRSTALIADEMGLGKTVQALGVINADPSIRKALLIVPAYLKINWKREAEKWLTRDMTVGIATSKKFPDEDVVILNYEIVKKLRPEIDRRQWDLLVCDESHYLKNGKAQRTQAVLGARDSTPITARKRLFLTGTPILNRPIELFPILKSAGLAKGYYRYAEKFCAGHHTRWGYDASGASNLDELQELLRTRLMIRRLKEDVLTDLPPKRHQVIELDASSRELKAAVKAEKEGLKKSEEATKKLKAAVAAAKKAGDKKAYAEAVKALASGRMAHFSEISKLRHQVALAKAPQVIAAAAEIVEGNENIIVFAHHRDVAQKIADGLKEKGVSTVLATGGHSIEDRQKSADAFQDGRAQAFVGTIKSCGTGLTLTAASTVIFAELDWTPGSMSQAEDRAHRIGQTDSVLVQHLVAEGSIDATMARTLVDKEEVIDSALDGLFDAELMEEMSAREEMEAAEQAAFSQPSGEAGAVPSGVNQFVMDDDDPEEEEEYSFQPRSDGEGARGFTM